MTTQIKRRRGTTTQHSSFTGAEGELTIDTTKDTVVVHDGITSGGHPLAKESSITGKVDKAGDTMTGDLGLSGADITFGDNDKAIFGAGSDLQIYHEGNHSFIKDTGTGDLKIQATNFWLQNAAGSKNSIRAVDGAEVNLYYNSALKLATTSTGVDITGTLTSDGLTVDGGATIDKGTGSNALSLKASTDTARYYTLGVDTTSDFVIREAFANATRLSIDGPTGDISFYEDTGTTPKFFWDASAERLAVGGTTTNATLHVHGNSVISNGNFFSIQSSSGLSPELDEASNGWAFTTNGSERLRITSAGSVGIGTSSPPAKLTIAEDLNGPLDATAFRLNASSANDSNTLFGGPVSSGNYSFFQSYKEGTSAGVRALAINPAGGNVGIGTSSPAYPLQVEKSTDTNAASGTGVIKIRGGASTYSGAIGMDATGMSIGTDSGSRALMLVAGGSERMRIDSSGNLLVGKTVQSIGTDGVTIVNGQITATADGADAIRLNRKTSDGSIIDIRKNGSTVGSIGTEGGSGFDAMYIANGDAGLIFQGYANDAIIPFDGNTLDKRDAAIDLGYSSGRFKDLYLSGSVYAGLIRNNDDTDTYIQWPGNNTLAFNTGGSERMRIDSSGKLSLTASDQGIQIGPDIAAYTIKRDSSGLLNFRATQQNFNGYIFDTVDGERMRIDSSGNVLIHRTSPAASAKGISFAVDANGTVMDCGTTYSGFDQMRFWHNGNRVGTIQVTASSTSYVTSSDYRLKTDAQPMTGASARVQALKPVNFEWIADGTRVDGFLAHEAQTVVPEAVTGTKDAMRDEEYEVTPAVLDDDGNVVTEAVMGTRSVPDYQGIDQSKLVPLLTAALQEALTKIDALETRITALEG
jgi:hypothetical protein